MRAMVSGSKRSLLYELDLQPVRPRGREGQREIELRGRRSRLRCGDARRRRSSRPSSAFSNANITWNTGLWLASRGGASSSTNRSYGRSWLDGRRALACPGLGQELGRSWDAGRSRPASRACSRRGRAVLRPRRGFGWRLACRPRRSAARTAGAAAPGTRPGTVMKRWRHGAGERLQPVAAARRSSANRGATDEGLGGRPRTVGRQLRGREAWPARGPVVELGLASDCRLFCQAAKSACWSGGPGSGAAGCA